MSEQLKTLIALCEEEKHRLQKLIAECLAEHEYLHAHYHSSALFQLYGQLQRLHNLDDRFYDDKKHQIHNIMSLKKALQTEPSPDMREWYMTELVREKEKLEQLSRSQPLTENDQPKSEFSDALQLLLKKKIKNLKLILKKEEDLKILFYYTHKSLKVKIPNLTKHQKKLLINERTITKLEHLGFQKKGAGQLVLILAGQHAEILNHIQWVFSKIVFELFHYREFENGSYLEYTQK